ncbi:uncharacterized protein si:dkey-175m17.7 [Phyllopteryx taeniolatus]|uniref:uncharacterized protein si:dkey-175m17.7 n=1 Tax=Phyllopteryx taeniolatus TaxID=161469 RepID=UPI002AD32BAA|nr:uncharacterized protein si:dkey-175m17.7 [Phyllopteryx taeniolatus]
MPPLPLDERIAVIRRPENIALREASPQALPHPSSSNGQISRAPRPHFAQPPFYSPTCKSLTLECKRRASRPQKTTAERSVVPPGHGRVPSHRHSNGTVTLSPRPPSHTHTIDIRLTLDKGNSLEGTRGKCGPPRSDQRERRTGGAEPSGGGEHKSQRSRHSQPSSTSAGGGVLRFVPAQAQRYNLEKETATSGSRPDPQFPLLDHKHSKPGTVRHSLPYPRNSVPVPHAAVLNSSSPPPPARIPASFQEFRQPRASRHRDPRPHILHGLPLSPCTSRAGGFPSPDHTCTVDCTHPFGCGCWRLVRCRGSKGHASACQGGGSSSSTSFSCVHNVGAVKKGGREMGLRNLGGCLSAASPSNTSSTNSTVSEHRSSLFKPLRCASCATEAGHFESPAILRKKMVGGCLPCSPMSSSGPLRAIQSCVTGCNPKASHAGSSTCSYCSSDPIVVTFDPRRGQAPGRSIGAPHSAAMFRAAAAEDDEDEDEDDDDDDDDDDDYGVRTIWPEELARKMTHSTAQENHCAGIGVGKTSSKQIQNASRRTGLVRLDCRELREYAHSRLTDHAGRRRLRQDKTAALDFTGRGSGPGYDEQRGAAGAFERNRDAPYPRSPSPPSPVSFSPPPPSAPSTLIKPEPRQRDREGGCSLPSARSLHLALNSLDREQNEEKSRMHLSLPLSSSLPASLSDESAMTPDAENAVVSAILPFLFLGNERDARELDLLLRLNVGYVVNVTAHLPLYHLKSGLHYKRLPATDNSKQNLRQYFEEVFEFIEEAYQSGQGVLVHCQAGVSRSATVVIAYLMKHTLMTMTDAYKYVRSRRPVVSPNLNFMGQLLEFERDLNSGVTPRILMPKLDGVETQVMKGDTPVNSTMSVGQARKLVEQLKIEASFCRIKVSKAAADLMAYCDAHACDDPLITPVATSENPFREKKFFCALL